MTTSVASEETTLRKPSRQASPDHPLPISTFNFQLSTFPVCLACDTFCDPWLEKDGRTYIRCPRCLSAHMTNPPSQAELDALYREKIFTLPGNRLYYDDDRTNLAAAHARRIWLEQTTPGGRLLDIGCGPGHFLSTLDPANWNAHGIDVSPYCIDQARKRFDASCEPMGLDEIPDDWDNLFDAVTMWDVIEHVPNPCAAIARAAALLRPGGRLYLSTPDISATVARILGRRWHYIDPMQHLHLFSQMALLLLCTRAGLQSARRRTFGRNYTLGYLAYRLAYCYRRKRAVSYQPSAISQKSTAEPDNTKKPDNWRLLNNLGNRCVPIRLGDIMAMEAMKPV